MAKVKYRKLYGEDHRHFCTKCFSGFTVCYKPKATTYLEEMNYTDFCSSPDMFICQNCLLREHKERMQRSLLKKQGSVKIVLKIKK